MCEGLLQAPVELAAGHVMMQAVASWWLEDNYDRLVAPSRGGSHYGCGFSPDKVSMSGWFEHSVGDRLVAQRTITSMFSPGGSAKTAPHVSQAPLALLPENVLASSLPTPPPKGAEVRRRCLRLAT